MSRHSVLFVTGALCVVAAVLGFTAGQRGAPSETEVITLGAALYVRDTGGSIRECVGVPGTGDVWISVLCGDGDARRTYLFDRRGGLIASQEDQKT